MASVQDDEEQQSVEALRAAKIYAESIVETIHEPLLVLTPELRVRSANPAFYQAFQVRPQETLGQLVYQLGFDPIDAGGLDESWRQQPGTPVYVADRNADAVRRGLAEASPERRPEFRGTDRSPGDFASPR